MKLSKGRCQVLSLSTNNPRLQYRLAHDQLKIRLPEKDLGIVENKLDMSQQCAFAARKTKSTLGCITQGMASKWQEVILPFYSAVKRHIRSAGYSAGPSNTREM